MIGNHVGPRAFPVPGKAVSCVGKSHLYYRESTQHGTLMNDKQQKQNNNN